jgi:hypothetical protein
LSWNEIVDQVPCGKSLSLLSELTNFAECSRRIAWIEFSPPEGANGSPFLPALLLGIMVVEMPMLVEAALDPDPAAPAAADTAQGATPVMVTGGGLLRSNGRIIPATINNPHMSHKYNQIGFDNKNSVLPVGM